MVLYYKPNHVGENSVMLERIDTVPSMISFRALKWCSRSYSHVTGIPSMIPYNCCRISDKERRKRALQANKHEEKCVERCEPKRGQPEDAGLTACPANLGRVFLNQKLRARKVLMVRSECSSSQLLCASARPCVAL